MAESAKSATKDSRDNIKSAALKSYAAYNPSKARDPSCILNRITRILKGPCSSLFKQIQNESNEAKECLAHQGDTRTI